MRLTVYSPHYAVDGKKCYKQVNLPNALRLNITGIKGEVLDSGYFLQMDWMFSSTNTIQNNVNYTAIGNTSSFQARVNITRESDTLFGYACTCPAAGGSDIYAPLECDSHAAAINTMNHDHTDFQSCTGTVDYATE